MHCYPHARTVSSRGKGLCLWLRLPPGTTIRRVAGLYLFIDRKGRYLAMDGVWRTPKEDA